MGLLMTATNVDQSDDGLWHFEMPPHQVRHFGNTNHSVGSQSIILLGQAEYDPVERTLKFQPDDVTPINFGNSTRVIGIRASDADDQLDTPNGTIPLGSGDREFLELAKTSLSTEMAEAAAKLLQEIRSRSAGDLKRGKTRNFSNTPDNFWYVIIQPRINQLSFTIRGPVGHFRNSARLPIKDDRGNTLFKLTKSAEIPAAIELIFKAKRKL